MDYDLVVRLDALIQAQREIIARLDIVVEALESKAKKEVKESDRGSVVDKILKRE